MVYNQAVSEVQERLRACRSWTWSTRGPASSTGGAETPLAPALNIPC